MSYAMNINSAKLSRGTLGPALQAFAADGKPLVSVAIALVIGS